MKEKIPLYNIVNMFFVGSVFTLLVIVLFHNRFAVLDISSPFFVFVKEWSGLVSAILLIALYEVGFILNRASSIIAGPILTKFGIWPKGAYNKDISEISEQNSKFQSLITEYVLMRTHIFMYFVLMILSLYSIYKWFSLVCFLLIVIFVLAGRKHNVKINKIREAINRTKPLE